MGDGYGGLARAPDTGPHKPYLDLPQSVGKSSKNFNSMCNMVIILS